MVTVQDVLTSDNPIIAMPLRAQEHNTPLGFVIGITGGIGSGKSYVAHLLNTLYNIPVYDCDREARRLMVKSEQVRKGIISLIGTDAYTADGQLNKPVIAAYLFASAEHAAQVNAIVHPAVKADIREWVKQQQADDASRLVAVESAILIEAGFHDVVDSIVVVDAPINLRIERAMKRDGSTSEQVMARISQQIDDDERHKHADFIITNDGSDLMPQLAQLISELEKH